MKDYQMSPDALLQQLNSTKKGLSAAERAKRLAEYGPNQLKEAVRVTVLQRLCKQLTDPMILILIAAAAVSGITAIYEGESFADVIIILLVVVINAILGVVQENKAEKAIAALKQISAATSKVLRDGRLTVMKSEELVPGDVVVLEAGDLVPADGRLIECASLQAEEAALTGESLPVSKLLQLREAAAENKGEMPLGDRRNMVYMGSTIVYGRGKAVITATGMNTEMGRIAEALSQAKEESTPLQKKLNKLSKLLSFLVLAICLFILAVNIIREYPHITANALLDTFMVAVSLAVAAIPEGLAAVVTIVLSIGVTRMSAKRAVIRKLTAVETLGCAQVICSDKTGTLTQNKMTVVEHHLAEGRDVSGEALLAKAMALCSDAELAEDGFAVGEPTECALVNYANRLGLPKSGLEQDYVRISEVPFDSIRKRMSTIHQAKDGEIWQFTKGAPDEIIQCCTGVYVNGEETAMTEKLRRRIMEQNRGMADRALRVLGAAYRKWEKVPEHPAVNEVEQKLIYIGLVGMMDPVRPEVKTAITECMTAGIRPIMITGDHKDTAVAIALELGMIEEAGQAITGQELEQLTEEEFDKQIERYHVYARVQPEHKVRIVKAWKKAGRITAMTGDGVNDAPSIKNADIGIGMGITGTDVTKNVADMVLADDNFATIVSAVAEGRRIYGNIRKSIQFLLASNLSEVLAIFTATLMGFTILKPVHLLWINLITDCFPALALGMEEAEKDIMKRPPRNPQAGIFAEGVGSNVIYQGVAVMVITLAAYFTGHYLESGRWEITNSPDGTTMAFLTLSMTEVFHSLNMRSIDKSIFSFQKNNWYLIGAMLLSVICTTAVIYIPFLSQAFGFEHISWQEYAISIGLAFCIVPLVEIVKWIRRIIWREKTQ